MSIAASILSRKPARACLQSNEDYADMVAAVMTSPVEGSRLGGVQAVRNLTVQFPAGQMFRRPGMARRLGWVETLMVVAGVFNPDLLRQAAPRLKYEYTEVQAYGLHLRDQLPLVCEQLKRDPHSRRAVAHLGGREYAGDVEKPCISELQFQVVDRQLLLTAYIRSWDLVSGFIYDTHVLGAIAMCVSSTLHLLSPRTHPPLVTCFVGNGHVYAADAERGHIPNGDGVDWRWLPTAVHSWGSAVEWALEELASQEGWQDNKPGGIEVLR